MQIIWEAADITPGRRYRRPGTSETWMIGYVVTGRDVVNVSLSDGMVNPDPVSPEDMAGHLTRAGYWPEEFLAQHTEGGE